MSMRTTPGRTYKFYTGKPVFSFGDGLSYTTFTMEWYKTCNLSVYPSSNQFYSSIHTSIHPFIHSSIHLFIHLSIHLIVHSPFIHSFIYSSIHPSIHPFLQSSHPFLICCHRMSTLKNMVFTSEQLKRLGDIKYEVKVTNTGKLGGSVPVLAYVTSNVRRESRQTDRQTDR